MDVGPQLLQPFLVLDAEALFLVDDHQAELLELHRFRQDRMGADHDVHRAVWPAPRAFLRLPLPERGARGARS